MRKSLALSAAVVAGSLSSFSWVGHVSAQTVNPMWNLPSTTSTGTNTSAEIDGTNNVPAAWGGADNGWYMSPAPNPGGGYTNPGQRCTFYSNEPSGWSFWLQTFCQSGSATQANLTTTDNGYSIQAGKSYTFSSLMSFQDGTGPGMGYNAVTLANQTGSFSGLNTGDLYSYLQLEFLNAAGNQVGSISETDIPAGSVTQYVIPSGPGAGSTAWIPYSVTATAPAGAHYAELIIGWNNGGLDGGTGGQSAFADDASIVENVPEPTTLTLLGVGSLGLMIRRRKQTA